MLAHEGNAVELAGHGDAILRRNGEEGAGWWLPVLSQPWAQPGVEPLADERGERLAGEVLLGSARVDSQRAKARGEVLGEAKVHGHALTVP